MQRQLWVFPAALCRNRSDHSGLSALGALPAVLESSSEIRQKGGKDPMGCECLRTAGEQQAAMRMGKRRLLLYADCSGNVSVCKEMPLQQRRWRAVC